MLKGLSIFLIEGVVLKNQDSALWRRGAYGNKQVEDGKAVPDAT